MKMRCSWCNHMKWNPEAPFCVVNKWLCTLSNPHKYLTKEIDQLMLSPKWCPLRKKEVPNA